VIEPIAHFRGEYSFLSNFYPCTILYEGEIYPSAEHAYVAAKTTDRAIRAHIRTLHYAGDVKKFGRTVTLRDGWNDVRVAEMRKILDSKFSDPVLWNKLRATAPAELIEGNYWGDKFWGQCPVGEGRNELGKLLMAIRDDITRIFE
jgi:N-glycosidase YbiA